MLIRVDFEVPIRADCGGADQSPIGSENSSGVGKGEFESCRPPPPIVDWIPFLKGDRRGRWAPSKSALMGTVPVSQGALPKRSDSEGANFRRVSVRADF